MNKYKHDFLDLASKFDALTNSCGKIIEYASLVIEKQDRAATMCMLKEISSSINSEQTQNEIKQIARALKNSLISYYGYINIKNICESQNVTKSDDKTLQELLTELSELVGLEKVKTKVNDLIAYQKVQKMRQDSGLVSTKNTLHLAFTGNPGTGKTTVARIIGRIYKKLGLLSSGHFIEVSRTDLIAGYQGQTAIKVKSVIDKARGGVLFIDEAYSITENDSSDSYGRECLTELTKALEDYRDDLVVIVAGYTEPMNNFFKSNPGLKSRFNTFIEFEDYTAENLSGILLTICKNNDYILSELVKSKIDEWINDILQNKDSNFSNGRLMRNLYDDLIMNHAKRVVKINEPTYEELTIIVESDFSI